MNGMSRIACAAACSAALALAASASGAASDGIRVDFADGKWDKARWTEVRQAAWDRGNPFDQEPDHIVCRADPSWSDEELFKNHVSEVFSCIMLTNVFSGRLTVSTEASFDHRMAPAIVIADETPKDAQGREELRDFYEIVLYDKGLNVWRHRNPVGGEPIYDKAAYLEADFEPKKTYKLEVSLRPMTVKGGRSACDVRVTCGGRSFGLQEPGFPRSFRVGVIGSEGRCRFRSFEVGKN